MPGNTELPDIGLSIDVDGIQTNYHEHGEGDKDRDKEKDFWGLELMGVDFRRVIVTPDTLGKPFFCLYARF